MRYQEKDHKKSERKKAKGLIINFERGNGAPHSRRGEKRTKGMSDNAGRGETKALEKKRKPESQKERLSRGNEYRKEKETHERGQSFTSRVGGEPLGTTCRFLITNYQLKGKINEGGELKRIDSPSSTRKRGAEGRSEAWEKVRHHDSVFCACRR